MKRNAVNSYLSVSGTIDVFGVIPHRLKYDAVADDATQGVSLYRPSGMHIVRTPILPLSHGILSLIRRHIPRLRGEYFVSVMDSCDVDITQYGALLQHAARCQIQRVTFKM